jgi:DNA-binding transcriptional MerR regulator
LREIKDYLDLYDIDPSQAEQLRVLCAAVGKRLASLREQRTALEETIKELEAVERQAQSALAQAHAGRKRAAG